MDASRIVILDPGLSCKGGHHAGLVSTRLEYEGSEAKYDLVCHNDLDLDFEKELESRFNVSRQFYFNFYESGCAKTEPHKTQEYIHRVSYEFLGVFRRIRESTSESILYVYPSICWQHALSLSTVIANYQVASSGCVHIICLMFSPYDEDMSHYSSLGFRFLLNESNVKCYASDIETSRLYQHAFNLSKELPIHPCYLDNWLKKCESHNKSGDKKNINVGLYIGDARENKGFCSIPEILVKLLSSSDHSISYIIQYTINSLNPEIIKTSELILEIAIKEPRVKVNKGFLPTDKLRELIKGLDFVVFSYDPRVYRDKSSGILWLCIWCQCHLLFFNENTWLVREAERLGAQFTIVNRKHLHFFLSGSLNVWRKKKNFLLEYKNQFFKPFWEWLNALK